MGLIELIKHMEAGRYSREKKDEVEDPTAKRFLNLPDVGNIIDGDVDAPNDYLFYEGVILKKGGDAITDVDLLLIKNDNPINNGSNMCIFMIKNNLRYISSGNGSNKSQLLKAAVHFYEKEGLKPRLFAVRYNPIADEFSVEEHELKYDEKKRYGPYLTLKRVFLPKEYEFEVPKGSKSETEILEGLMKIAV